MSNPATSLTTLSTEVLVKMGRKLDSANNDQDWYALVQHLPSQLYTGYEGKKRIEKIAMERFVISSEGVAGSSGYVLLDDLRKKNVSVEELIAALEELGQDDCLELIVPKEEPSIVVQPEATPVKFDGTIQLMCKARGFPTPSYQWFCTSRQFEKPIRLQGHVGCNLVIRNARETHSGYYCCRVQNNLGYKFSHYAEVKVDSSTKYAPKGGAERPPVIVEHPQRVDVEMGKDVKLHVVVEGSEPLKYVWFKDAEKMDGKMTNTLILRDATPDETDGKYSCQVSNSFGSTISDFATVTVLATISVLRDLPFQLSVSEGDTLRLELEARGNPLPQYKWWKRSGSSGSSECLHNEIHNFLVIPNVQRQHAGYYRCVVSNGEPSQPPKESILCHVSVLERPQQDLFRIVEHPASHGVELNEMVRLRCRVESSHPVLYQWFKGATGSPISGANSQEWDVKINSERDWDVYRCSVMLNSKTVVSNNALIYDLLPIQVSPSHIRIGLDTSVQLQCIASDTYRVSECRWYKDDQLIPNENNLILRIQNPTQQSLGEYKCESISTDYGVLNSRPALVRGSESPHIISVASQVDVSVGDPFELRCEATGDNLAYQWMHESNRTAIAGANQSVYRVSSCGSNDLGGYLCSVRNEAGQAISLPYTVARKQVPLIVTLRPEYQEVAVGKEGKLTVRHNREPQNCTYRWFFNGQAMSQQSGGSEIIVICNAGKYYCVVSDQFGHCVQSNTSCLKIIDPPRITTPSRHHEVQLGEDITIGVEAAGAGPFYYHWLKDGQPVSAAPESHSLRRLGPISLDTAGRYECEVFDKWGQKTRAEVAQISVITGCASHYETRGAFLMYSSGSGMSSVDAPTTTSLQHMQRQSVTSSVATHPSQQDLAHGDITTNEADDTGLGSTDEASVLSYMNMDYAQVDVSSRESQSRLGRYQSCSPPVIVDELEDQEVVFSNELTLSCRAQGTPTLYYQWFFNGEPFGDKTVNNTLRITNVTAQHGGRYCCKVVNSKNEVSTKEATITVKVLKPQFTRLPKPGIELPVGRMLLLPYDVIGEPPINIQWKKDGKIISGPNEFEFRIPEVRESDSGEYTCVISNRHGSVESRPTHFKVYTEMTT